MYIQCMRHTVHEMQAVCVVQVVQEQHRHFPSSGPKRMRAYTYGYEALVGLHVCKCIHVVCSLEMG